jgi:cell division inhibitor SulA
VPTLALVPPVETGGLDPLLRSQRVWRAGAAPQPTVEVPRRPTGWDKLDAALPAGGWPDAALVEILIAHDGIGELALLLPALAALAARERPVLLVAPPYRPYAPAWQRAGVALAGLQVVDASPREAPWAMEQALRAGSCGAVLGWPVGVDDKGLRRLQVAAEAGQCLGVAFRPAHAAANPSPAPLRLQLDADDRGPRDVHGCTSVAGGRMPRATVRVLKCRGAQPPAAPLRLWA